MVHRILLARGQREHAAEAHDVAALVGGQLESEGRGIGDGVEHPAPCDVDGHGAHGGDLHGHAQVSDEGRHIAEGDRRGLAVLDCRRDVDQPGRSFECESRDRLGHLDHAGLDEHSGDADGVAARHRGVFHVLHDHVAVIGCGIARRQDEIAAGRRIAARLIEHELAQVVTVSLEVAGLLEHGRTWHIGDTTGDDPAGHTVSVDVDGRDPAIEPHG